MFKYEFSDNSQTYNAPCSVEGKKRIVGCFESHKDKRRDLLTVGCARQEPAGCKPHPVRLIGGRSSPACASYALRKVADEIETPANSETVLIVKKSFDVDHCLNPDNSVDEAAQTPNELHCFCYPSISVLFVCLQYTVPLCLKDLVWHAGLSSVL